MTEGDPREALARNPFLVLGLTPGASRAEVEREGQRLLDALALGMAAAASYPTPLGTRFRGPEEIRAAMAELRDPERRVLHELFAPAPEASAAPADLAPWPDAPKAMGWGRR